MKILRLLLACLVACPFGAWAWGPLTHAYIASCVTNSENYDLIFGSGAPDLNGMIDGNPAEAGALRSLSHHDFERLAPSAFTTGFTTHNESWGADSYAHSDGTYASDMMAKLEEDLSITASQAHTLFESCIDMQIRLAHGPGWGTLLAESARASGTANEDLMVNAYAGELAARVTGLTTSQAAEDIRKAMQSLRSKTITLGNLMAKESPGEIEVYSLPILASYLGVSTGTARTYYEYAMAATEDTFQAELNFVCTMIKQEMPEAIEGEQAEEGETLPEGEVERVPCSVTITACAIAPNPVPPGQYFALSGLAGNYNGGTATENVMLTIGLRDTSGAWKGGTPQKILSGAPGINPKSWSGSTVVLTAPTDPGVYHIWVRNTVTTIEAPAVQDFKKAVPLTADEEHNDRWDVALVVGAEDEGEGEAAEGEGETPNEGEGETTLEGEGETPPEGESLPEGEGERSAEGEGETALEGEGEGEEESDGCFGASSAKNLLSDWFLIGLALAALAAASPFMKE